MKVCLRAGWQFVLGISLFTCIAPIYAAADWPPITPEEQAIRDVAGQPGASAIILQRQEIADDLNNFHSTYKRIKVLTEAGRKYADIELPYNRRGFSIAEVSGRTVRPDGTVVPFDGKPFDKVLVRGRNVRIHVKAFTLPDVQVGSILDVRYSLRYDDRRVVPPGEYKVFARVSSRASNITVDFSGSIIECWMDDVCILAETRRMSFFCRTSH
jgi:hypothetical protein